MAIMNTHLDWREFPFLDVEVSPNIVPRCLESRNLMESLSSSSFADAVRA